MGGAQALHSHSPPAQLTPASLCARRTVHPVRARRRWSGERPDCRADQPLSVRPAMGSTQRPESASPYLLASSTSVARCPRPTPAMGRDRDSPRLSAVLTVVNDEAPGPDPSDRSPALCRDHDFERESRLMSIVQGTAYESSTVRCSGLSERRKSAESEISPTVMTPAVWVGLSRRRRVASTTMGAVTA